MSGPNPPNVVLTDRQRAELERIARRAKAALWRGRWLEAEEALTAAEGEEDPKALTEAIRAVLSDAPRSGGPPKFSPEQLCAILAIACEPPEESGHPVSHWTPSPRRQASAASLSRSAPDMWGGF